LQRYPDCGAKVHWTNLLAASSDPNGFPLTFVSTSPTSTNGGTVGTSGNWIFYTPQPGFTGSDAFSYTITNSAGLQATGTVTVAIEVDNSQSQNVTSTNLGGGSFFVNGNGIPGYSYRLQFAPTNNLANWQYRANVTADSTGAFQYADTPGADTGSYRTAYP
jgi:hypothetical protein